MRPFINIITEAQAPKRASFRLHPALDPNNYVMTNSLRDHAKWRAMTYVGNNSNTGETGHLHEVGYIMISLVDDTIIPISRDDEHHMGRDLLYDLADGTYPYKKKSKKIDINPSDYIPIWKYGANYIYDQSEVKDMLIGLSKFLSYGGPDGVLVGTHDYRGKMMHSSDFVAAGGFISIEQGKLAPVGQRVYDQFNQLARLIGQASDDDDRIKLRPVFLKAAELCKFLCGDINFLKLGIFDMAKEAAPKLREIQKANDLQALRELVFGFHGIKNTMHMYMKKVVKDNNKWSLDDLTAMWGDVDLAIDMLARM